MNVITLKEACPLCKGDLTGNDKAKYFCEHCNILFSKHSLESK